MKRYLLLLALATSCLWAKSSIITTHGTDCSVATNCLVASLVQDQGGATLVLSGTWTGTIQFEATGDGGATWASVNVLPLNSTTAVTSTTANGTWQVNIAGFTGLRMRSSASMTGSATATITPSAASARSNGGGGGGGGSPGGSDTQGQFNNNGSFDGSPGLIFNDSTKAITSINANNATYAGSAYLNIGGTASGVSNLTDYVDQTTGNIFRFSMSGATYNTIWDPVVISGWNCATGGGKISNSFGALCDQVEGDYNLSGAGTDTMERHFIVMGTNGAYTRWFTGQWSMQTGINNFANFYLDKGVGYYFGIAGDGTPITASAAWSSPNGGTFTYTIGAGDWPWDYQSTTTYVTVSGCSTSAYNFTLGSPQKIASGGSGGTTFTLTGVGSNPGSGATGCAVQGGIDASYASITPGANGIVTAGNIPIIAGGALTVNGGGNATAGIQLLSESGVGGGTASGNPYIHAGGSTLTNGVSSSLNGLVLNGGSFSNFECDGSNCYKMGTQEVGASTGLYHSGSLPLATSTIFRGSISGGLVIAPNWTSDTAWGGLLITTNGGGASMYNIAYNDGSPGTALTTEVLGAWNGVTLDMRDGGTSMIIGDGSGDPNLENTVKYHGTNGVSVSGILCTATFATVAGGVTACTATSDPRLKDYEPLPYGLDAIMHIQPIKFRWNALGRQYNANDTTEHLGFNAQNIQQVMPEAVGTETHDGTDYLSLPHGTDGIVAALVKAVQEQQAQIEQLKAAVAQLKAAR